MRYLGLAAAALLGLAICFAGGFALGQGATETESVTDTETERETVVRTTTRTRTVRAKPVTVRQTLTETIERPPTSSFIDYGEWDGYLEAYSIQGYVTDSGYEVVGQIEYLGGLPNCNRISYLQIDATLFEGGRIVATEFTNMTSVPEGSRVPFELTYFEGSGETFRYELLVTRVTCE